MAIPAVVKLFLFIIFLQGAATCFAGLRMFRLLLVLNGIWGTGLLFGMLPRIASQQLATDVSLYLLVGMVGGLILVTVFHLGVFLSGAGGALIIATALSAGLKSPLPFAPATVIGILGGAAMFFHLKKGIQIASAAIGAAQLTLSFSLLQHFLLPGNLSHLWYWSTSQNQTTLFSWLTLTILGLLVQSGLIPGSQLGDSLATWWQKTMQGTLLERIGTGKWGWGWEGWHTEPWQRANRTTGKPLILPSTPENIPGVAGMVLKAGGSLYIAVEGPIAFSRKCTSLPVTIGRRDDNTIVLFSPPDSDHISRVQAQIENSPKGLMIRNCGSQPLLKVNGNQVSEALLQPGDSITIEPFRLSVRT